MVKYFCDACGKEIKHSERREICQGCLNTLLKLNREPEREEELKEILDRCETNRAD